MAVTDQLLAYATVVSIGDLRRMAPAERQRLAAELQRVSELIRTEDRAPRPGVLGDLVTRGREDR